MYSITKILLLIFGVSSLIIAFFGNLIALLVGLSFILAAVGVDRYQSHVSKHGVGSINRIAYLVVLIVVNAFFFFVINMYGSLQDIDTGSREHPALLIGSIVFCATITTIALLVDHKNRTN